jgi:hypothetical protein
MKASIRNILILFILSGLALISARSSLAWSQIAEPSTLDSSPQVDNAQKKQAILNALAMRHGGDSDAVVARVNDSTISMAQLMDKFLERMDEKYQNQSVTKEVAQRLRLAILEELIMEELAYRRGMALDITIDPGQLKKAMESMSTQVGGEENPQEQHIIRYLVIKETIAREVNSKATVTEEEVDQTYEEVKEQLVQPEMVVVTDVTFFLDPDLESSIETVNEVRRENLNEHSGKFAKSEDNIFVVEARREVSSAYKPQLYKIARKMEAGTLSQPLVIDGTLHLLRLDYHRQRKELSESKAKRYVASRLKSNRKKEMLAQWREKLRQEGDVEIFYELLK